MLMEIGDDYQRAAELGIERAELEPIVLKSRQYRVVLESLDEARSLLVSDDEELRQLAEAEINDLEPQVEVLENELKTMLLPTDSRDQRNVIMEIRAGTGGDEAAIFAADLFRMYSHYSEHHGWSIEVLSSNQIGVGGFKEIVFTIKGKGAYSRLKYESGVHRVQRVPITESQVVSTLQPPQSLSWRRLMKWKSTSRKTTLRWTYTNQLEREARACRKTPLQSG